MNAYADIGDGPNTPQIHVEAQSPSAIWNGYPIHLRGPALPDVSEDYPDGPPSFSSSLLQDVSAFTDFDYITTPDDWTPIDSVLHRLWLLKGYRMRIRYDVMHTGTDGSIQAVDGITNQYGSLDLPNIGSTPTPADSGWISDVGPDIPAVASGLGEFGEQTSNTLTIPSLRLIGVQTAPCVVLAGSTVSVERVLEADPYPNWPDISPTSSNGKPAGSGGLEQLTVHLATDGAGVIASTWADVVASINADTAFWADGSSYGIAGPSAVEIANGLDLVLADQDAFLSGAASGGTATIHYRGGVAR